MQTNIIEGFPLSPQQKRLWLLQQNSLAYRAQLAILIDGNIKVKVLKEALQDLVNQHEILRTKFHSLAGMKLPIQVISDSGCLQWREFDLSSCSQKQQEAKIEEFFSEEEQRPFDFEQDPLLRLTLLTLSAHRHILLLALPSLCADARTLKNIIQEISQFYARNSYKERSEAPVQYVQFSALQNELLEAEDRESGTEYWRKKNISALLNLRLPFETQPIESSEFQSQYLALTIHPDTLAQIEAIVQEHEVSTSIFFLTCWQILLWHLAGKSEIVVGTAYDGRVYEELEELLGLVAKYLPIHCSLEENYRFSEVLQLFDESIREAYEWQEYFAWEQAVAATDDIKEQSFLPFCFDFQHQPVKFSAGNVSFEIYKQYTCIDRFKVKLSCIERGKDIITEFHYDSSLFSVENINRLARQFYTLLENVVSNPEKSIGELQILSDVERQQLVVEFNNTKTDYFNDKCIHQLIEEQAQRTPDKVAVVFQAQLMTYQELNQSANQLAHRLQALGVKPDVLVGICLERSLEMLVGILGILKAGGAYVPIDPTYPNQRLAYILEDSQVSVLLTQQRLVNSLPDYGAQILCLDTLWDAIAQESNENPHSGVMTDNLAYLIYTSGSTGQPKGVQVTHQNLVHSTIARTLYYHQSVTSFLLTSPFAFDSSVASIFWTLCQGISISLPPENFQLNLIQLIEAIAKARISHLLCLPSLYKLILEQAQPQQLVSLQTVIVAGETCPKELVKQHHELLPHTSLFNEYGPTEATVWSSVYDCQNHDLRTAVPIGRPIANTQIYLLDSHLQPVPIGVPGEVHIGGFGLARGYLNRPELTAQKFIPNPFSDKPSARLYKTGDLARYLADGNIEFLGRLDHQVKIRGYRIELTEIEAVLNQHTAVRETIVVAQEGIHSNKRLVAYVVPSREQAPTVDELRSFLKDCLPEYMMPSVFVILKALPLTPNGKVDRQALPAPDQSRPELQEKFVAPITSVEADLAKIWSQVFGLEQVGIHDNFFALGGDSILSLQIVARAHQAGLQLIPKQLFDYPTIAELAVVAGTTQIIQAEQGLVTGLLPLIPIQHWFFEMHLPNPHHYNQAILLEVQQALKPALLEQVVQKLLVHHDALRMRFIQKESGWQQINASKVEVMPFTSWDLSMLPETEQLTAIEANAAELQASLNISEGPLVRVALFDFGSKKPSRLLIVIHHLVVDGVSWRILLEDLEKGYKQLSQSETIQLSAKTTSFKQWAERLMEYSQTADVQQEMNYWLAELPKQVSRLPVDYLEGKNTLASARTISLVLEAQETRFLLQEVPKVYRTEINDVLLTALVQSFAQWTGVRSLLVHLEGHGREEIFADLDLSRTVGWFTTFFPVFLAPKESSHVEVLKAVKQQLNKIPNRGIDYGVLRYLSTNVEIVEQLRALPQPEVSFNYLGQLDLVLPKASLFRQAQEFCGATRDQQGRRNYLLEVNGCVIKNQLHLEWTYSEVIHQRVTVEKLAQSYVEILRSLISHCQSPHATSYTSSDFAEFKWSQWSQADLDKMIEVIGEV